MRPIVTAPSRAGGSTKSSSGQLLLPTLAAQAVFMAVIKTPNAPLRDVSDLFAFYRPHRVSRYRESAIVKLSSKQHDVMYALAGCSDVTFVLGSVKRVVGV
jgi:hypothetical protein